ncbi:hypothetical protein [Subtercola sp. YIM 133946]|uniref:hypothetical protein n=1 Tax=Subtercola sp. YIM 133946 TaxID=3118909 RepID=UPI002F94993F
MPNSGFPFIAANRTRDTAQEIDPLSGITARIFVAVVGLVSVASAVALAVGNGAQINQPVLQIVGLVILLAAYVFFVIAAEPYRRRVTRKTYAIVLGLVIVASLFDALSQLGTEAHIRDDWGPICVALVLMVAGPYRPPLEIVVFTAISLVAMAAIVMMQESAATRHTVVIALVTAVTPSLALGIGAAIYSGYLIAGLRADRGRAAKARELRDTSDRREAIEEFLGHDVEALRADVLPFFRELRIRDALSEADIERAAELQTSLRASLVARLSAEPLHDLVGVLDDPQHLSRRLSEPQRTALRAFVSFLADQPSISRSDISLTFSASETSLHGTLDCPIDSDRTLSFRATPFVGLLQLAFDSAADDFAPDRARVEFSF